MPLSRYSETTLNIGWAATIYVLPKSKKRANKLLNRLQLSKDCLVIKVHG